MNKMYLLVAGSRDFIDGGSNYVGSDLLSNYDITDTLIKGMLDPLCESVCIVHGGARGADSIANRVAVDRGYDVVVMPADWSMGRGAGMRRNADMHKFIQQFPVRKVLLIWDGVSHGTLSNFKLARQYNNPLFCYLYKEQRFMDRSELERY